ncbi:capsular polysaccharide export protein, LipB/KpsS family [Sphingopyxis panaciterrae]
MWDWRGQSAAAFRGNVDAFPHWFEAYLARHHVTDILLFGDNRPLHRHAIHVAKQHEVAVFVVEEGLLRPNFVSLERGGTNYASPLPRDLDRLRQIVAHHDPDEPVTAIASEVKRRVVEAVRYYIAQTLTKPLFLNYRSHRQNAPLREAIAWVRRRINRRAEDAASAAAVADVRAGRFFLFPMQLDGDHQIDAHSDFPDMASALDCAFASFSAFAPEEVMLLVKMHPFDPDIDGWRACVAKKAARFGIGPRVRFIERFDLGILLESAAGVVTINSTVGPLALEKGCPVFCLGRAVYDIPGITAQCSLGDFWMAPPVVHAANFDLMCRAMRATALVNGGFHDDEALRLLVDSAVRRLAISDRLGLHVDG